MDEKQMEQIYQERLEERIIGYIASERSISLEKAMEKLKPRELHILKDRFLIGKTQMEIASELGISQAQISRIEKSAISNIKKLIK